MADGGTNWMGAAAGGGGRRRRPGRRQVSRREVLIGSTDLVTPDRFVAAVAALRSAAGDGGGAGHG